jgi:hypothetical protein
MDVPDRGFKPNFPRYSHGKTTGVTHCGIVHVGVVVRFMERLDRLGSGGTIYDRQVATAEQLRGTALHTGTTAPPAAARDRRTPRNHRGSGLPVLQQFRTSESERCEQHTVVQRATLARSLLAIDQPELLRNSFKQVTATGTNYGILCMHDND